MILTISHIVKATQGNLLQGNPTVRIKGVSINSRTLKRGELFIAIKGENFDGHSFIQPSLEKGALALVVSQKPKKISSRVPVIYVKDTTIALGRIAAMYRSFFKIPVISITGSAGKTTTKEMVAAILQKKFKVLKNIKTENNHIGVPLTLLKLDQSHEVAVIECGTNRQGDIDWLGQITKPDVIIFTNIGESHLELLKTPDGVFKEKYQLTKHLHPEGYIIFNADDAYLRRLFKLKSNRNLITYALKEESDYHASQFSLKNNQAISFNLNGNQPCVLNSASEGNLYNALAAISCGRLFKINYKDIQNALSHFRFPEGRQNIKRIGRLWIINDTYNANPVSFKNALETLYAMNVKGKRILVCADMLELGKKSLALHRSMGEMAAQLNLDLILTLGPSARIIAETARRFNQHLKTFSCDKKYQLHKKLRRSCQPEDAILIKGSRRMHMEETVDYLTKNLSKQ